MKSIVWMVIWAAVLVGVLALIAVITPAKTQQLNPSKTIKLYSNTTESK